MYCEVLTIDNNNISFYRQQHSTQLCRRLYTVITQLVMHPSNDWRITTG